MALNRCQRLQAIATTTATTAGKFVLVTVLVAKKLVLSCETFVVVAVEAFQRSRDKRANPKGIPQFYDHGEVDAYCKAHLPDELDFTPGCEERQALGP